MRSVNNDRGILSGKELFEICSHRSILQKVQHFNVCFLFCTRRAHKEHGDGEKNMTWEEKLNAFAFPRLILIRWMIGVNCTYYLNMQIYFVASEE